MGPTNLLILKLQYYLIFCETTMAEKQIKILGEGSIEEIERGRKYRIRLRIPPSEPGGKRKWSPRRTVYGNKAQARIEIEKYRIELEDRLNNEKCHLAFKDYTYEFQEQRKELGILSPLTIVRDDVLIGKINQFLGDLEISDITPKTINSAYAKMRKKGISTSELHKIHQKLNQILKKAVREDIIITNPCDRVDPIKNPEPKARKSLTLEQACQLASDLKNTERNGKIVAVWLALATGIRRGEALGLLWKNVNLENGTIFIKTQLDSKCTIRPPKSKKSIRRLSIDSGTIQFLKEWKEAVSTIFYDCKTVPENSPVCCNEHGDFIEPTAFNRWRRKFFADHGLGHFKIVEEWYDKNGIKRYRRSGYEGFNFHELRHTQATLLIGSGADIKTVQNRLGHSSASLTMDIYAHAIEQNDKKAAETIGGLLNGSLSD